MIGKLLLDRYELLEKIGEGGMGTVYKAKCHLLNRFVAVKILKAELGDNEDFLTRFRREATSIARLSDPNIVNVHDVGEEDHVNFIVMEYINGKTLKKVIKENGRLSAEKTIDIVFQIAKALECAHINNIIHRDIKPDNIMITEDNMVKVMDFGIAKVVDSTTMTNCNNIIGTVHYFSPEQAKGNFVDCRTDIYSLGIVMYEMVTGRVPYNAESAISIAMMHIKEPIIPPKEIITDIPENINQVILKAMQKEPIKRYQTAKEMAEILSSIKQNSNYKVNANKDLDDATRIMSAAVVSDIGNDFTRVMGDEASTEKTMFTRKNEVIPKNKKLSTNKKAMIVIASIILVMIASVLGKFISKDTSTPIVKTTVPKVEAKLPVVEKKFVPSLIGETQDIAMQTVVNNGFLLGNITNNYSDSIDKGLVISQLPVVNTSYEKDGKIDLVISLGKEVVQTTPPQSKKGKGKKK
ncbi:Stk1 family PASTA domain-containing Ser/Thr kinase [Clostridium sp.]|uniref:Stk1 family PASTA domain-containing Ser/Thr kinase n=1 Tax=Clostridium sp. TaxID=1506 RepID=UPI001A566AD7|nr:Stk1 family PASTA domain-containing Ser/Thr kinase [Clostridium sp.]MBK5236962.1 Stk1 family PASTA domain-containing Ser/Thr kinase [Clostridium sp.]